MVNQLLAGVHIASAAEAMAFGARLGLDTRLLFDDIKDSEGTSWYDGIFCLMNCYLLRNSLNFKLRLVYGRPYNHYLCIVITPD